MNYEYLKILKMKNKFTGIEEGFKFLNLFLDSVSPIKNKKENKKNSIKIFDYRINDSFELNVDYSKFYIFLQDFYFEFLIKNKFQKYKWYNDLCKNTYIMFSKDLDKSDIFADLIIKILTKSFLYLSNFDNSFLKEDLKKFLFLEFVNLKSDITESEKYADFIVNSLINFNLFEVSKDNVTLHIKDQFIYLDFLVTSAVIAHIFSTQESDLKYSTNYGLKNLPSVIDFYLFNLVNNDSFFKSKELFSCDLNLERSFLFLTDYSDINFQDLPKFEYPFSELFIVFFLKKLILNEYCFHTVILSSFEYYLFDIKMKNILMDKTDFMFDSLLMKIE